MSNFADDSVYDAGPNYVSFEQSRVKSQCTASPPPPDRTPAGSSAGDTKKNGQTVGGQRQASGTACSTTPQFEFTLNANDVICFYGRNSYLSNFYTSTFTMQGHRYYSVEHYYEAVKLFTLLGPQYAVQLKNVQDPAAAKAISRRFLSEAKIDRKSVEQWRRQYGIPVVNRALVEKFSPGSELAKKLIGTGTALLAQTNPHDDLWAVNMIETEFSQWMQKNDKKRIQIPVEITADSVNALPYLGRKGKNLLGFLLMQLRRRLQERQNSQAAVPKTLATIDEDTVDERCEEIGKKLAQINMLRTDQGELEQETVQMKE